MPLVSIIIPTYNRADLIGETLESVETQTWDDWECVVVDDGSTDHLESVVEEYRLRDSRFRYVRQPKSGKCAAMTRGMAETTGEFVALLDSDDVWLPGFLDETLPLIRRASDTVLAASCRWAWNGVDITGEQVFTPEQIETPLRQMIRHDFLIPTQCLLRRRDLDASKGFRNFPCDDYDLWLQILPHRRAAFVEKPLVKYRRHDGNQHRDDDKAHRPFLANLHIRILREFARRRDITLGERLLALGNIQRKQEQLLQFAMEEGKVPSSRLVRLWHLLKIVPSPLLRSPGLARRYLSFT